jgi:hypothetical protein
MGILEVCFGRRVGARRCAGRRLRPNRCASLSVIVGALCRPSIPRTVTDASSSRATDDPPTDADDAPEAADDRPDRPPRARLVDAIGVIKHAKRGLVVGVALAAVVFGFFVLFPLVDPSTPSRPESAVLYVALAFVVATTATLLVASALAVRTVAGHVMDYEKWVRRSAIVAGVGGAWWALTGLLAIASATGTLSGSLEAFVVGTLPLPVLLLAAGAWSALARTGTPTDAKSRSDPGAAADGADHVLARPRLANGGAVVALVGVTALHVATFVETDAFRLATAPALGDLLVLGSLALAGGAIALADALGRHTGVGTLAIVAGVLASAITTTPALAALGALVLPGLAWLALGVAIARDPGTYPERPV